MDELRNESMKNPNQLEPPQLKNPHGRCIYDQETICSAPRIQFGACKTCHRINPHKAVGNLFDKIKQLATDIFNLPQSEPDQFPPRK